MRKPTSPNPPHGKRRDFTKLTVTLPDSIFERIAKLSRERKRRGEPNHKLTEIARELLDRGLQRPPRPARLTPHFLQRGSKA